MAVAKKDQDRVTYARLYGQQARKDGEERVVPTIGPVGEALGRRLISA